MNHRVWQLVAIAFASVTAVVSCSGTAVTGDHPGDDSGTVTDTGGGKKADTGTTGKKEAGAAACGAKGPELCANGGTCKTGADCTSTVCQTNTCVAESCSLGTINGMETDVNCGGPMCGACPDGDKCKVATDCQSLVCTGNVCQAPTDTDTVKNDSETDKDCGGGLLADGTANPKSDGAPACGVGKMCLIGSDCTTGVCASSPVLVDNLDAGSDVDAAVATSDGGAAGLTCQPATFKDGVKNDSETDTDCGGALLADGTANPSSDGAPACAPGRACVNASDCQSLVCVLGTCDAATFKDGVKNDSETDTDCGGGLLVDGTANPTSDGAPACADHLGCLLGNDCVSLVCSTGVVTTPSPDGTPIDCPAGSTCTCQPAAIGDGVKNDSETDIDCGGGFLLSGAKNTASDGAPLCVAGMACTLGSDCAAGVCNDNMEAGGGPVNCPDMTTCQCQFPSSNDTVQNGGETDVDCGGATAPGSDGASPCANTKKCVIASDCQSLVCNSASKTCTAPSPTDGVQNGTETDVDCGGGYLSTGAKNPNSDGALACADSKGCALGTDCRSAFCSQLTHVCVDGQSCVGLIKPAPIQDLVTLAGTAVNGNDAVGVPDPNGAGQSAGIDTCGAGESTDPVALQAHESCCKSLLLPPLGACSPTVACPYGETCSSTTGPGTCQMRLDKYEVTTGRVRQFIESVKASQGGSYNLQAWVKAQLTATGTPATPAGAWLVQMFSTSGSTNVVPLIAKGDIINDNVPAYLSIVAQLGGTILDAGYPSTEQGCYSAPGAYGATTYWWPSDEEASVNTPPRPFTQDYYDIKPINCAPYWIGAAFCAWDGGRLPTLAESYDLYPTNISYPWSLPGNAQPALPVLWSGQAEGALVTQANNAGYAITNYTSNWHNANLGASTGLGDFYFYPSWITNNPAWAGNVSTLNDGSDLTPYTSAPGRFTTDLTYAKSPPLNKEGWLDYGANMFEYLVAQNIQQQGAQLCDTSDGVKPAAGVCPGGYNCTASIYCGVQRTTVGMPAILWEGGSWEGHGIQQAGYGEPMFTQYGKAGFRCARPVEP